MCAVSKKRRLGKGLSDLLGGMDHLEEKKEETAVAGSEVSVEQTAAPVREKEMLLRIEEVHGNPDQPRKHFDPEALQELSDSIRHFGVLQPLLVQRDERAVIGLLPVSGVTVRPRQPDSRKYRCWSEITARSRWRKFPSSRMCSAPI